MILKLEGSDKHWIFQKECTYWYTNLWLTTIYQFLLVCFLHLLQMLYPFVHLNKIITQCFQVPENFDSYYTLKGSAVTFTVHNFKPAASRRIYKYTIVSCSWFRT